MKTQLACGLAFLTVACASADTFVPAGPLYDRRPPPVARESESRRGSALTVQPGPLSRSPRARTSPTETRLTNGVRVLLLEQRAFPAAQVAFVLDRGADAAPSGVGALYAHAMRGSSREHSARDAYEYLGYLGARASSWVTHDAIGITVTALAPLITGAVSRVAPMFASPTFAKEDLARARAEAIAIAARERDDPKAIARATLASLVFPEDHPYARGIYPAETKRLETMSRFELESFRNMFVVPERVTVVAVGAFDRRALLRQLERSLGRLPAKRASLPPPMPSAVPPGRPKIVIVRRKGASQSNVAIGFPGARYDAPVQAALRVLSSALGRGLSSRLSLNVRGEHGFSYGVRLRNQAFREGGMVVIEAAVDTPHTAEAVAGLLGELERVRREPIDEQELTRAKIHVQDDEDANGRSTFGALQGLAAYGLPLRWDEQTAARASSLTSEEVRLAAEQLFSLDTVQIAVVGDADAVAAPLRAMGTGEVVVVDP
jgi:zinc protease